MNKNGIVCAENSAVVIMLYFLCVFNPKALKRNKYFDVNITVFCRCKAIFTILRNNFRKHFITDNISISNLCLGQINILELFWKFELKQINLYIWRQAVTVKDSFSIYSTNLEYSFYCHTYTSNKSLPQQPLHTDVRKEIPMFKFLSYFVMISFLIL